MLELILNRTLVLQQRSAGRRWRRAFLLHAPLGCRRGNLQRVKKKKEKERKMLMLAVEHAESAPITLWWGEQGRSCGVPGSSDLLWKLGH